MQIETISLKPSQILVFKTSVETVEEKKVLLEQLSTHPFIQEASIDLEDVDKVLRIITAQDLNATLQLLETLGANCSELD